MKLPANWKTSLFGFISVGSLFVVNNADLVSALLGQGATKRVFSVAALVSGFIAFKYAKDKNVVGGDTAQTLSGAVAKPTTQTLVDETVKTTIASGEKVTPEQERLANS